MMNGWRVRDGKIFFNGRLFAIEVPDLPAIFAMEARADLELGARRAREAAIIEMQELAPADISLDDPPVRFPLSIPK
jgi:hypothetical protein